MVYLKSILFILLSIWGYQLLLTGSQWVFLDNINLVFHEAGHVILFFTGTTLQFLAGSLFQLLIPLVCLIHFLRQNQLFSMSFCLFWLGESLNNVSIYIKDAQVMNLNLIGGQHDWNTLFTQWNLLDKAVKIGNYVQFISAIFMLLGLSLMFTLILKTEISNQLSRRS